MKKFNLKEKFLRIALATVTVGMLMGAVFSASVATEAATDPTGLVKTTDGKVMLGNKLFASDGYYNSGVNGINDPIAVRVDSGKYYYTPSDYVYYGSDSAGNPILWRVLDANNDSAGNSGATFLFSEQIMEGYATFSDNNDDTIYKYYSMIANANANGSGLGFGSFYQSGRFEYTYELSYMGTNQPALRAFLPKNLYGQYYSGNYLNKNALSSGVLGLYELSALRPVTKVDELYGNGFGMNDSDTYWTTDTIYGDDGVPYTGVALNNAYIFPLSVDELQHYVANYSGAPGLAVTTSTGQANSGWWLRTAYNTPLTVWKDENTERKYIYVGRVDNNGTVSIEDVNSATVGGRYGINLEQNRVVYGEMIEENVWRLGIIEPFYYENTDKQFNAWMIDVKSVENEAGETVLQYTLGYNNAIGRYYPNYWDQDAAEEFISVMIKDKDGNVKYYGTVDVTPKVDSYNELVENDKKTTFTLPADVDFNEKRGDKMVVFWERKSDDYRKTSFTSNLVEIECAHSDFEPHNCQSAALCKLCGEEFGYRDYKNHLKTKSFNGTPEDPCHGIICVTPGCPEEGKIVFSEACTVVSNCVEVFEKCSCGNSYFDESTHIFDNPDDPDYTVTGYCERSNEHYQPASIDISGNYVIKNVANFLWLGQQVNAGNSFEGKTVIIDAQVLDFGELQERGIRFFDIGTSSSVAFKGTLDGRGAVIRNLKIDYSSNSGFFSYTVGATIKNLSFENIEIIGGYYGGVVVSNAINTTIENIEVVSPEIGGIVVGTAGALDGGIVGVANDNTVIRNCLVYGAVSSGLYDSSMTGKYLPLIGYGNPTIINSYYLADKPDENGGRTLDQMASGEIAYLLGWGQNLSGTKIDPCPRKGSTHSTVHQIPSCGGDGIAYGNIADGREAHEMTRFVEADGFTWDGMYCTVTMGCVKCDYTTRVELSNENGGVEIVDNGGGVSYTFTAIVDASNGYFTDETHLIAKRIEDVTAVEPIVKDFDGNFVYADDLLANTKMNYQGFSSYSDAFAYFVDSVTGEYRGIQVAEAGVYDLVVDGMNNYEGQKYIYKEIVKINKISLTLDIKVENRPYDGTDNVTYEIGFLEETEVHMDWLIISVGKPTGTAMGRYDLKVSLKYDRGTEDYYVNPDYLKNPYSNYYYDYDNPYYSYDMFKNSIDLKWSDTVEFIITPQRQVIIGIVDLWKDNFLKGDEEDYGLSDRYEFTYGDKIAAPTAANFSFDEGSELSFEWYEKKNDGNWDDTLVRIPRQPTDAGEYVLRVVASATDNLVKSYIDIELVINKKTLTVGFIIPEDAEFIEEYGEKYYIFTYDNRPEFVLNGVSKDEWEALGISFDGWYRTELDNAYRYYEGYPTNSGRYFLSVDINVTLPFGGADNYEIEDNAVVYAYIPKLESIVVEDADYTYDGYAKDVDLILPENWTDADYEVVITDDAGRVCSEIREVGRYTVTVTDKNGKVSTATVTVRRELKVYVKELSVELTGDGFIAFDLMGLVFEAVYSPAIGHTLADLKYEIDVENGIIYIVDWKVMAGDEDVSDIYFIDSEGYYWRHQEGGLNVAHIYDNPCDRSCNVCGLERVVPKHKGGTATCCTQAVCEVCGEYYGKLDSNNHETESEIFVPSGTDLMMHDLVHACCGEVIRSESHSVETAATCISQATCTLCRKDGYLFGELDPNNHASDEYNYSKNSADASAHDKYHACCGVFVATEAHSGGEANCVSGERCEYCSEEYGEIDPHNHANAEAHTPATCKTSAKCSECGEYYGELDPTNHESDAIVSVPSADSDVHDIVRSCCGEIVEKSEHTGGVATCNSAKICSECGAEYGEKDPENHASDEYAYYADPSDSTRHIRSRACCGIDASYEEHVGISASCLENKKCEKCEAELEERGEHVYDNACDNECNVCGEPTRGLKFHFDENKDGKCDHCGETVGEDDLGMTESAAGCAASVGAGTIVLLVVTFGSGWMFYKKKED